MSAVAATTAFAEAVREALAPFRSGSAGRHDLAKLRECHRSVVTIHAEAEADARRLYRCAYNLTSALNLCGEPAPETLAEYALEANCLRLADERRAFARDLAMLEAALLEITANHEGMGR